MRARCSTSIAWIEEEFLSYCVACGPFERGGVIAVEWTVQE